jgi:hypothetical protein
VPGNLPITRALRLIRSRGRFNYAA